MSVYVRECLSVCVCVCLHGGGGDGRVMMVFTGETDAETEDVHRHVALRCGEEEARNSRQDEEDAVGGADAQTIGYCSDEHAEDDGARDGDQRRDTCLGVREPEPAAAGSALGAAFVRVAHFAFLVDGSSWRTIRVFLALELHVVVGEGVGTLLTHVGVGACALGLLDDNHHGCDRKPHDKAHEEVEPCKVKGPRVRPRKGQHGHDLLAHGMVECAALGSFPAQNTSTHQNTPTIIMAGGGGGGGGCCASSLVGWGWWRYL
jgi:hypothetical protein